MAEDLLRSVIELEKSIQRQLAEEQRRATAWLERERQRRQARLEAERRRLAGIEAQGSGAVWERLAARLRRHEARELAALERFRRRAAAELPERLDTLLTGILPGDGDDHQDVQG